jgi:hypothetical protein
VKKKNKEIVVLFFIIVFIPAVVYFTSSLNKIVCAHTFSDDGTASLLGVMEEYKAELNLIKSNAVSNFTLSKLHVDNILDQGYISRIANQLYPEESRDNGDLTKSFNTLNKLVSGSTDRSKNNSASASNEIKAETDNIDSLLDNCKKLFIDNQIDNNNTVDALTIKSLLDSSLRFYESGMNIDSSGNAESVKNYVYYQNALGIANKSNQLLNQMDVNQFQNDATKANLFRDLQKSLNSYENYIKNTENYNKIMVLLHMNIHPNLIKLFNLK